MIYTGEDKRKVYLKCEKCNHITNVPKAFIKENNNEYIKISIALSCDCKTGNETDIFLQDRRNYNSKTNVMSSSIKKYYYTKKRLLHGQLHLLE